MLMSVELKGLTHVIYIFFGSSLDKVFKCAKFHHCRICVRQILGRGTFLPPPSPSPGAAPKKPIHNRVKVDVLSDRQLFLHKTQILIVKMDTRNTVIRKIDQTH